MKYKGLIFLIAVILLASCKKEFDKFERPEWLEGKMYDQLLTVPDIDSFVVCVERSGYDTIINTSGSYTAFAPDNNAMNTWLSANSYGSVWDIPEEELAEIVKYHIVQNPWSRSQLQTLDIQGWIDVNDPFNNEPWGYKRQTLLKDENRKYFVKVINDQVTITDSLNSNSTRMVFVNSRKYVPLFFDQYMALADISKSDYESFFKRSYEPGNIFFANSKLGPEDYFAENGFIYVVDELVTPFENTEQLLERELDGKSYSIYQETVYRFPQFAENETETNNQDGASEGQDVPTLYDLDYSQLVFDIHEEMTGRNNQIDPTTSIRYHYGLLAPDNTAMNDLIDNHITASSGYPHWANWTSTPDNVKRIILNSHMAPNPIYKSDIDQGFLNGSADSVFINSDDIVETIYGSNATFHGLKKAILPRALSSVSGPVYLRPGFLTMMYAIEYTNILAAIKRRDASYSLFVLPDWYLNNDSSLVMNQDDSYRPPRYSAISYDRSYLMPRATRRSSTEITIQLLNQVGTSIPRGVARKEFIENLGGNFIVFNSENHPETGGPTITGGASSVYGYNGDSVVHVTPTPLDEPTDNGITYSVDGWLSFTTTRFYDAISQYDGFYDLMVRAGLVDQVYYRFNFVSESEFYTVFIPSDEALASINTDTMSQEELQQLVKYHFVRGQLIFTDGNKPSMEYETMRVDESSTEYSTVYSTLDIRTSPDILGLYNSNGDHFLDVIENDTFTNHTTALNLRVNNNDPDNYITNGVLHVIDSVLIKH